MTAHRARPPQRFLPVLALTVGLLVVPACAAPILSPDSPSAEQAAEPVTGQLGGTAGAWSVSVPAIAMSSTLAPMGLNPDRTMEVAPVDQPEQAGWYRHGPRPGEVGPAIVTCHVNGAGRPGCGARFDELVAGDDVVVTRPDRAQVAFRVTEVLRVPKSEFPTARVYSDTAAAELRLITCGGALDSTGANFVDNTIVFAEMVS